MPIDSAVRLTERVIVESRVWQRREWERGRKTRDVLPSPRHGSLPRLFGPQSFGQCREASRRQSRDGCGEARYHFREHLPPAYLKTWQQVAGQCPDYCAFARCGGHGQAPHPRRPDEAGLQLHQIEERIVITEYRDDRGEYRHAEKFVVLKLTGGGERDVGRPDQRDQLLAGRASLPRPDSEAAPLRPDRYVRSRSHVKSATTAALTSTWSRGLRSRRHFSCGITITTPVRSSRRILPVPT